MSEEKKELYFVVLSDKRKARVSSEKTLFFMSPLSKTGSLIRSCTSVAAAAEAGRVDMTAVTKPAETALKCLEKDSI